ncbi:MAG: NAD(P)H-hydrate dehydratase [Candidatus Thorarchaeota archaeon]|nr:NAD(P)H-hydrate dehydratase [Candidatus Thorarchaeota archaeon]
MKMETEPVSSEEMRILELNAQYLGITHSMLMQNAGREVARIVSETSKINGKHVVFVCGLGGNGGDGLVAARYLDEEGAEVDVYLLGDESGIRNKDTLHNWDILSNLHDILSSELITESAIKSCRPIQECDVIVDGIMGFGLHSKLREPLLTAVKVINKSPAKKYSIDIPSGIDSDSGVVHGAAVKADHTITLHAPKVGMEKAKEFVGKLHIVSIGIPKEAKYTCGPGDLMVFNSPRLPLAKKGDFGRILVVGGSDVYSGAPALSAMAALRTGADLVRVLAPDPVVTAIRSYSPNLMVTGLGTHILVPETAEAVIEYAKNSTAVAIGPGLGLEQQTKIAVVSIVEQIVKAGIPLVLDADGLKSLAASELKLSPELSVLTPHWGELSILMEKDLGDSASLQNRVDQAIACAGKYNSTVLLKGPVDVVAAPGGEFKLNRTGVPAMTVGGTGDVLTGIVAALLARKRPAFLAASAGAFVSGMAGEMAFDEYGDHIVATDCIEKIHSVFSTW